MNKLFDPENPVTIILSRIFDLILLNICFVLSSLPVITVGASLTAMYRVTLRMAEGEFGDTVSVFFSSFRKNLRQGTLLWLILTGAGIFLGTDIYVVYYRLPQGLRFFQIPVWLLLFWEACALLYSFPMLSRYEQTNIALLKNSLLLGLGNIPLTVSVLVITGIIVDLSMHNGSLLVLFLSLYLFIGCALSARIFSVFLLRAFKKAV